MKFIKKIIAIFIETENTETKPLTPLEKEKRSAFWMLFPF